MTDKLAQIERDINPGRGSSGMVALDRADVMRLVEIARAAQAAVDAYTHDLGTPEEWRAWNNQDGDEWPTLLELAAAVARLKENE